MSHPPLRFALVGCGRVAGKHAQALVDLPGATIAAVCDVREDRASVLGQKLGVPHYTTYRDLLEREEVDIASILTPSGLHARHTIDIVRTYRKHIVCEKPMALQLEDADQMIRACDDNGVRLFVVKQNRYNRPVQRLRDAIQRGRFGRLVLGTVRVRWLRDQAYYDADPWRGTWRMDGGCLSNQASHHIDLLEWMMGAPVEVTAMTATRLLKIEVEDTAAAVLRFANGALGIVEATVATRPRDLEGSLSILGERGSVEIGGFAVNQIKTWLFSDPRPEDEDMLAGDNEHPLDVYGHGHRRYLEGVVDCVRSGKQALVDGLEGRRSLELLHAIYQSAESGRAVSMVNRTKRESFGGGSP